MQAEQQCIDTAVEAVRRVVSVLWGQSRTVLFGSQATGLALPGSDLDIVVLGVTDNMSHAAAGFSRYAAPAGQSACCEVLRRTTPKVKSQKQHSSPRLAHTGGELLYTQSTKIGTIHPSVCLEHPK